MQTIKLQFCKNDIPYYRNIVGSSIVSRTALFASNRKCFFSKTQSSVCYITLTSSYSHFPFFVFQWVWLCNCFWERCSPAFIVWGKFKEMFQWCKSSLIFSLFLLGGLSGGSLPVTHICWILYIQLLIL